jgi:hypothetical protein
MGPNGRLAAAGRPRQVRWLPAAEPMCSSDCICRGRLTSAQCSARFDDLLVAIYRETA